MAKNALDRIACITVGTLIVIGITALFIFGGAVIKGDTTVRDIKVVTKYAEVRGIYNLVETGSPFLHTGDCKGAYYISQKAILTACGRGTSLDKVLSVYLHELGHSQQVLLDKRTPEQAYQREIDAWNRGEALARELKVWNRIDKFEWELIKQIGLHSYRQRFQPTWNFIR